MIMRRLVLSVLLTASPILGSTAGETTAHSTGEEEVDVAAEIAQLETSCSASSGERRMRQEQRPLYIRLGQYDRIRTLTGEIVRLHLQNALIRHLFQGVDTDRLAGLVADFMASGTGGPQHYKGRDMRASHAHLELTDAHFLAAGGDVGLAMQNLGYAQEEIDEVVCILVSLRDEVVRH